MLKPYRCCDLSFCVKQTETIDLYLTDANIVVTLTLSSTSISLDFVPNVVSSINTTPFYNLPILEF